MKRLFLVSGICIILTSMIYLPRGIKLANLITEIKSGGGGATDIFLSNLEMRLVYKLSK